MKSKPFRSPEFKIYPDVLDESKKTKQGELMLPKRLDDGRAEEEIKEKIDLAAVAKNYYRKEYDTELIHGDEDLILNLVEDLARLVLELKDKLTDYDAIVSDDASGRLPSLFFQKIINRQKKKNGQKGIKIFFVAGGRHGRKEIMNGLGEFFAKNKEQLSKVLLVTEYVDSGNSISRLIDILRGARIDFDLAAISLCYSVDNYKDRPQLYQYLRYGGVNNGGLYFYNHPGQGITKVRDKIHPVKKSYTTQQEINDSRKNIDYLADQLAVLAE